MSACGIDTGLWRSCPLWVARADDNVRSRMNQTSVSSAMARASSTSYDQVRLATIAEQLGDKKFLVGEQMTIADVDWR